MPYRTLALTVVALSLLSGCGAPTSVPTAPSSSAVVADATALFTNLKDVRVLQGAPSDWYVHTRRYVSAKTAKNGKVWILDDARNGLQVLHNTQQVTNARKLAELVTELEAQAKAAEARDPQLAKDLREFATMLAASRP